MITMTQTKKREMKKQQKIRQCFENNVTEISYIIPQLKRVIGENGQLVSVNDIAIEYFTRHEGQAILRTITDILGEDAEIPLLVYTTWGSFIKKNLNSLGLREPKKKVSIKPRKQLPAPFSKPWIKVLSTDYLSTQSQGYSFR